MNLKELKKLAALLRSAGVTHYKTDEIELTLSEQLPEVRRTRRIKTTSVQEPGDNNTLMDDITQDGALTENQLLFYSAPEMQEGNS